MFIYLFLAAMMFASCESCSKDDVNGNAPSIQYSLTVKGDADGSLSVVYGNAEFQSVGTADLMFKFSNVDTVAVKDAISLTKSLQSNSEEIQTAALKVNSELDAIEVKSAEGTYYLNLNGYAKEPVTGLVFNIDRTFTNRVD